MLLDELLGQIPVVFRKLKADFMNDLQCLLACHATGLKVFQQITFKRAAALGAVWIHFAPDAR